MMVTGGLVHNGRELNGRRVETDTGSCSCFCFLFLFLYLFQSSPVQREGEVKQGLGRSGQQQDPQGTSEGGRQWTEFGS